MNSEIQVEVSHCDKAVQCNLITDNYKTDIIPIEDDLTSSDDESHKDKDYTPTAKEYNQEEINSLHRYKKLFKSFEFYILFYYYFSDKTKSPNITLKKKIHNL